jgi:hypothetical protein
MDWKEGHKGLVKAKPISGLGVTFIAFVDDGNATGEAYVGSPFIPGDRGDLVAAWHSRGDIETAKMNAVKAFKSWADTVMIQATSDGRGNITMNLEE